MLLILRDLPGVGDAAMYKVKTLYWGPRPLKSTPLGFSSLSVSPQGVGVESLLRLGFWRAWALAVVGLGQVGDVTSGDTRYL